MIVALFEPEIPQNTGNIARLCAVTDTKLLLVGRLGFSISDKYLKRAGMDYWNYLDWEWIKSINEFFDKYNNKEYSYFFISKFGKKYYTEISREFNFNKSILIFGNESYGLREDIRNLYSDRLYRIPMKEGMRSLNLSNSVAIVVYHLLEKTGFNGLT
ncbi:rRNA methylase [Deferribacter desulfuricans SSM1]|uniref:Putative tRNA (cytidine(34)-2'-O)-methyltransferase n=1 Tax=Deferribacter desulfuricans (strain DSM 14783 / JCM 11476 / NBRC 101012 / SSM1) TaxID=639282 RepID=D3PE16_DEFDS|nr:tRNA (cytidine(34)-2'-O)-methyltransferase [Deferribacter desulfuricans]BAI80839.1 rRNA methylase [Deferribacter desulfuricans SSM1]